MSIEEDYEDYMNEAREKGDLLWKYHQTINMVDHLLRIKEYNAKDIFTDKVVRRRRGALHDKWKKDLDGLIRYLRSLPDKLAGNKGLR